MKTPTLYGVAIGVASALILLAFYFLGYHSDLEKMNSVKWPAGILGFGVYIVGIVLAIRARRAEVPANQAFGYGRALAAGVVAGIVGAILSAIFYFIYLSFINPGMVDLQLQQQVTAMEAKGVPSAQIEKAQGFMSVMMKPVVQLILAGIFNSIYAVFVSLIAAIFIKRSAPAETMPPPVPSV